jgi:4-amino-4-deoxy-L-arabinose transferase-like glycosyltransferase
MWPRFLTVALLTIAGLLLARLPVLASRVFDPDELEHAHAAWSVFRGMVPYKDFFEHHTPWYYYVLRPLFNWFDVDTSFVSARNFLLFGRGLSLALTIVSVWIFILIGRRWRDRKLGLLAGVLLVSQPVFFQKTFEIRPDVLALPFYLGSLWFLLAGMDAKAKGLRRFVAAGLCLGAAMMCTQKMLFVLPGALAGLGFWSLSSGTAASARPRILRAVAFVLGVGVPVAATWAAFAAQHAAREFITNNFLLNASWQHTPTHDLPKLLVTSGPIFVLGLAGIGMSLRRVAREWRSPTPPHGDVLLICTIVVLFAGVLVVPVAYRQYYLMPLPILCLFAGQALWGLVDRVREPARAAFLAVALLGLGVLPALSFREAFRERNDEQLAWLRKVFHDTKPTDLVMDGWQGMGVFRPHAFYYFFLHSEAIAVVPPARLDAYLDALESRSIRPKLIALDDNLKSLGPRFMAFVEQNYASRDGFLYYAR